MRVLITKRWAQRANRSKVGLQGTDYRRPRLDQHTGGKAYHDWPEGLRSIHCQSELGAGRGNMVLRLGRVPVWVRQRPGWSGR